MQPHPTLTGLIGILLVEALAGLVLSALLTFEAAGLRAVPGAELGAGDSVQFAAAGAFVLAVAALIAARAARRRRSWAWTLAALIQLPIAIATGLVVLGEDWHPAYLLGFVLAALAMLLLSAAPVRSSLGQT